MEGHRDAAGGGDGGHGILTDVDVILGNARTQAAVDELRSILGGGAERSPEDGAGASGAEDARAAPTARPAGACDEDGDGATAMARIISTEYAYNRCRLADQDTPLDLITNNRPYKVRRRGRGRARTRGARGVEPVADTDSVTVARPPVQCFVEGCDRRFRYDGRHRRLRLASSSSSRARRSAR